LFISCQAEPIPLKKNISEDDPFKNIDDRDCGTPDDWVHRDEKMVRLTGRHPFNSEPPLGILHQYRFITPTHLHIVRNHGAVPHLTWEGHTLLVGAGGVAPTPYETSMDDLAAMPTREFAMTISCCGNRRKEMNMIKQTIGFNWGAAAVGTNVWKGVLVRDLLLKAGITDADIGDGSRHVEFIGYEDLPNKVGPGPFEDEQWGKLVKYGTSLPIGRVMSPVFDVMIAFEANGERLLPDHGFPCRLVIPGYIGGRMIKWLKEIRVLEHESHNHYHWHDNKIMPPHVDAEEALSGGWWYKQEYIINDLSLQSVISQPNHNDTLSIAQNIDKPFEIGGYAHSGGGRPVLRVEVTLDGGITWLTATIDRKEKPNPYGMYWCWVWWAISIPTADLVGCEEIWCRAWDSLQSPQANEPTWSLMGQQMNHVFRVKVRTDRTDGEVGDHVFRFEHPTQPGQLEGGWATRVVDKFKSAGYGTVTYGSAVEAS
jgi:nitrate reductase (NAD(P)H)